MEIIKNTRESAKEKARLMELIRAKTLWINIINIEEKIEKQREVIKEIMEEIIKKENNNYRLKRN
jgi:hypothetical protein